MSESQRTDAEAVIEQYVPPVSKQGWHDTLRIARENRERVARAVCFLEVRGLVERYPGDPKLVRVSK